MRIIGMKIEKINIQYAILNFFFQMYLDLIFCSLLSFYNKNTEIQSDKWALALFILTFIMIVILPAGIAYLLNSNFESLESPSTQEKYGFAY